MATVNQHIVVALLLVAGAAAAGADTTSEQNEAGSTSAPSQTVPPAELPQSASQPNDAAIFQQAIDLLTAEKFDQAETLAMSLVSQPATAANLQVPSDLQSPDNPQSAKSSSAVADNPQSDPPCRAWAIVAAARERAGKHASALRAYRLFLATCQDAQTRQYITQRIDACQDALAQTRGTKGLRAVDAPVATATPAGDASGQAAPQPAPNVPTSQPSADHSFSAERLQQLAKVEQDFSVESSEHFVVHARNPRLAKLVTGEAEAALGRICSDLLAGTEYSHSVEIYVYSDHSDYLAHATDAPEWSGGAFTFQVKDGQVIRKISLTQLDKDGKFATIMFQRVLPHEMCHLVLTEYFGDATCPLFLNEGLAMLAETGVDNERVALAGAALAGKQQIKLDQLFVKQRQDMDTGAVRPEVFYAESYSFLSYIHTRLTRKQFGAFVEHLKDSCTVADSLQRALFVPTDDAFVPQLWSAWTEVAISQAQDLHAVKGDLSIRD